MHTRTRTYSPYMPPRTMASWQSILVVLCTHTMPWYKTSGMSHNTAWCDGLPILLFLLPWWPRKCRLDEKERGHPTLLGQQLSESTHCMQPSHHDVCVCPKLLLFAKKGFCFGEQQSVESVGGAAAAAAPCVTTGLPSTCGCRNNIDKYTCCQTLIVDQKGITSTSHNQAIKQRWLSIETNPVLL